MRMSTPNTNHDDDGAVRADPGLHRRPGLPTTANDDFKGKQELLIKQAAPKRSLTASLTKCSRTRRHPSGRGTGTLPEKVRNKIQTQITTDRREFHDRGGPGLSRQSGR